MAMIEANGHGGKPTGQRVTVHDKGAEMPGTEEDSMELGYKAEIVSYSKKD